MKKYAYKKTLTIILAIFMVFSINISAIGNNDDNNSKNIYETKLRTVEYETKQMTLNFSFSDPEVIPYNNYHVVRIKETNHNKIIMFDYDPGKPVLPVNISVFNFEFGTKIKSVDFTHSDPEMIELPGELIFCKAILDDKYCTSLDTKDVGIYENDEPYPNYWISYNSAGGLYRAERTTFFVLRVYPVRYYPADDNLQFISDISVSVTYEEPTEPIINEQYRTDLLIITPTRFKQGLKKLVEHKEDHGVKTQMFTLDEVYEEMKYNGRDNAEKIKYFIKMAIENWNIKYVLLVGGIKGQSKEWDMPVRYSKVVPTEEQEYPEQSFISDIYYSDIYDGEAEFSSWDSNYDNKFSVWNETFKEEMDLYQDVYLGRIPCRSIFELNAMVKKIINYEKIRVADQSWFNNLFIVAGDSYHDTRQYNEGELIGEAAIERMPGFNPVRVYASQMDINRETVNSRLNNGASFAYFCGHGNPSSWTTHFPPDGLNKTTGYKINDMIFLKNKEKQPITFVGGCHNGQFDTTLWNMLQGILDEGFNYFRVKNGHVGGFFYGEWVPNCWAWWLTSKPNGGAIATIANTGLGTHGDGDQDFSGVADYLEILDGWLELRFLEQYGIEGEDILGLNHGDTLSEYLNIFLGDDHKMDVKMVQQWELFGDPSLKIGGYS